MKNIIKAAFLIAIPLLIGTTNLQGQNSKFGHINSNDLLALMPDREKAAKEIENFSKELENQLRIMSGEYESKLQDYQSKESLMTEPIKQTKLKEIMDLEQRIREFQQTAQESLQKKENELLTPIINKAKKAIDEVAKEKGYTYIFDSGVGVILYVEDKNDILPLVKNKLGL
ncbi:MAG: OmpH family outer membrane protein [Bacteroidota bacterium]